MITAPSSSLLAAPRIVPFKCPTVGVVFHVITGGATALVKSGTGFVSYAVGLFSALKAVAAVVSLVGTA